MGVSGPITREPLITSSTEKSVTGAAQQITGLYLTEELGQNVFVLRLEIFNIYPS